MRFCLTSVFSGLLGAALYASGVAAQETGFTPQERELHYLFKMWPGDYDNQEQVSFDARARGEAVADQPRVHGVVRAIDLPSLGEYVLYSEEREGDDPAKTRLRQIYVLSADEEARAVRVKSYAFKAPQRWRSVVGPEDSLAKVRARDLVFLEGCDILLRRDGESHAGAMEEASCRDGVDDGYRERHIRISEDYYSTKDRLTNERGEEIDAIAGARARNMKRARWFACMVDVPKDIPGRSNYTQHYIKIHDQGGAFSFTHPDGREMTLLMRNTWSYGMQRETFFIGVFEGDASGKLLVYGWGMPGADRIGVNPGYVRIQCDLDTPENVALQKGLREES